MADRSAALAALVLALSACGTVREYIPQPPPVARIPAVEIEVESLETGPGPLIMLPHGSSFSEGMTVHLRWRASEDALGIAGALLAAPEAAPCTAGIDAEIMTVDGQVRWDRPLGLGRAHAVQLS